MAEKFPKVIAPVLDAEDSRGLAEFWKTFLGLDYRPKQGPDDDAGFIVIDGADGAPALAIQKVDHLPRADWPSGANAQQVHLDLAVDDRDDQRDPLCGRAEQSTVASDLAAGTRGPPFRRGGRFRFACLRFRRRRSHTATNPTSRPCIPRRVKREPLDVRKSSRADLH